MQRETRIVSVCLDGPKAMRLGDTPNRVGLVDDVVTALSKARSWGPIDAVVFPGGFLRLKRFIGDLSSDDRLSSIARENFMPKLVDLARQLADQFAGAPPVLGGDVHGASDAMQAGQAIRMGQLLAKST